MAKQNTDVTDKKAKMRKANANKQRRYRESMKAQGYRARLVWDKPLNAGWTRTATPVIRESSINVANSNPAIGEVFEYLCGVFITNCEKKKISKATWEPVYKDFLALLKPFGF